MLEPVIDWNDLTQGQQHPAVPCELADRKVDAYLDATGEHHPLYAKGAEGGFAPMSLTTLVRFAKTSMNGRWPSGTVQLQQLVRSQAPLRRGDHLLIGHEVRRKEVRNNRAYFESRSPVLSADGRPLGEHTALSLWGGPTGQGESGKTAGDSRGKTGAAPAAATSDLAGRIESDSAGTVGDRFSMDRVRAFGEIAGARDPIHLDPEFARGTRFGRNIVQGRLVMTLLSRLMLQHLGRAWLERGWYDIRFSRPVFVDEAVDAYALPHATDPHHFHLLCRNARQEIVIEGQGGLAPS